MNEAIVTNTAVAAAPRLPSLAEATRVWFKIGCLSFGGPAGQIALLHREVVDDRNWVSDRRFLHALNFCHLLPGPEAQQLAIYLGWLMHGPIGGFSAGLLFIIPGAVVMLALSLVYATLGTVPLIAALFYGLKSAVLVLVVEAVLRIGRRALKEQSGTWESLPSVGSKPQSPEWKAITLWTVREGSRRGNPVHSARPM